MKITIAPDSYKGCLSASEICDIMEKAFLQSMPGCTVFKYPMADGGEGTVECLVHATNGHIIHIDTHDVFGKKMKGFYGSLGDGKTAVIESACASGIQNIPKGKLDPMRASSYGTGEILNVALNKGYDSVIIGFGGTASSDGAMGALAALGMKFYDKQGKILKASGQNMAHVHDVDASKINKNLGTTNIIFACDVNNPYHGKTGAAHVYAPQKGANKEQVELLDQGLENLANIFKKSLGKDIANSPCAGAAGGLAGGLMSVCDPVVKSGFDVILSYTDLEDAIKSCDIVFTGEGRTDAQTAYGKLIAKLGMIAKKHDKPVVCICGSITQDANNLKQLGITSLFSICNGPMSLSESIENAVKLLYNKTINVADLIKVL